MLASALLCQPKRGGLKQSPRMRRRALSLSTVQIIEQNDTSPSFNYTIDTNVDSLDILKRRLHRQNYMFDVNTV